MRSYEHKRGFHKIVDGVAVRTPQAKIRERHISYRRAGIPDIVLDTSLQALSQRSAWKRSPIAKSRFPNPRIWWFYGDGLSDRMLCAWAYLAKKYIDNGLTARRLKITEIIDAQFDSAEKSHMRSEIAELDLLVIDLTNSNNHKLLPTVFGDMHATRSRMRGTTIYLSDDDVGTLTGKYGTTMSKIFENRTGMTRIASRKSSSKVNK